MESLLLRLQSLENNQKTFESRLNAQQKTFDLKFKKLDEKFRKVSGELTYLESVIVHRLREDLYLESPSDWRRKSS